MNEKTILVKTSSPSSDSSSATTERQPCSSSWIQHLARCEPRSTGRASTVVRNAPSFTLPTLCAPLGILHERHIIYSDLQPENQLLNEWGKIKLTDVWKDVFDLWNAQQLCARTHHIFRPHGRCGLVDPGHRHIRVDVGCASLRVSFSQADPREGHGRRQQGGLPSTVRRPRR